jgi:hypothetical protein
MGSIFDLAWVWSFCQNGSSDLSYGAFGLLVMAQKEFGYRPFLLKDVLNRGESVNSTKKLLRELVNEGFLSSGQLRQVATGYFSIPQYRLIQELPITFIEDEPEQSVNQPVPVKLSQ